jgi:hypothetical protein
MFVPSHKLAESNGGKLRFNSDYVLNSSPN